MMEITSYKIKPIEFKAIQITSELGEQIKADYLGIEETFNESDYRKQRRSLVDKYHGLVWSDTFGYYFLANHGKDNQGRMQAISLNDRIIEDSTGEQFLIHESLFERYFM